jgi:RNA polymerase primary sigma factor
MRQFKVLQLIHNKDFENPILQRRFKTYLPNFDDLLKQATTRGVELADMCNMPVLTPHEEQHLFRQYNCLKYCYNSTGYKGYISQINAIQQVLFMCNVRLIVDILKRKKLYYQTFHDLFSDYYTIMRNAIDKFDYSMNFKFSSYLARACKKSGITFWKKRLQQEFAYINDLCKDRQYDPPAKPIETDTETIERYDNIELLFKWANLTAEERNITMRNLGLFGEVETFPSMRSDFGNTTRQNVGAHKSHAIRKLRKIFDRYPALYERFLSNSGL